MIAFNSIRLFVVLSDHPNSSKSLIQFFKTTNHHHHIQGFHLQHQSVYTTVFPANTILGVLYGECFIPVLRIQKRVNIKSIILVKRTINHNSFL